jgi:hypothetical protein
MESSYQLMLRRRTLATAGEHYPGARSVFDVMHRNLRIAVGGELAANLGKQCSAFGTARHSEESNGVAVRGGRHMAYFLSGRLN